LFPDKKYAKASAALLLKCGWNVIASHLTLRWWSQSGKVYRVLRSPDVGFANFDVIASGVPGSSSLTSFTDTNLVDAFTNVFYRFALDSN
jgi:hypothetical protein